MQTTQDLRATQAGDLARVIECRNAGVPIDCHDELNKTIRTQITLSTTTCDVHNVRTWVMLVYLCGIKSVQCFLKRCHLTKTLSLKFAIITTPDAKGWVSLFEHLKVQGEAPLITTHIGEQPVESTDAILGHFPLVPTSMPGSF